MVLLPMVMIITLALLLNLIVAPTYLLEKLAIVKYVPTRFIYLLQIWTMPLLVLRAFVKAL